MQGNQAAKQPARNRKQAERRRRKKKKKFQWSV
jgi:hypothetical protein